MEPKRGRAAESSQQQHELSTAPQENQWCGFRLLEWSACQPLPRLFLYLIDWIANESFSNLCSFPSKKSFSLIPSKLSTLQFEMLSRGPACLVFVEMLN
jgi:hypothetical protein